MSITNIKQQNLEFLRYYNINNSQRYFNEICAPIKSLIPGKYDIAYARIYKDNSINFLRTESDWLGDWITNFDKFDGTLFQERIKKSADSVSNVYCAWHYISNDALLEFNHQYGILQGFDIYKRNKNYVEFWGFLLKNEMPLFHDFFISNISMIETLIDSCSEKIDLLKQILFTKKAFLNLQIGTYFDNHNFTSREIECIRLIIEGQNTKEIAKNLDISPRTVEVYISHLKQKAGCYNKTGLISKFRKIF